MAFRSTGTQKIFPERITQQGIVEEDFLWSKENLNDNLSVVDNNLRKLREDA